MPSSQHLDILHHVDAFGVPMKNKMKVFKDLDTKSKCWLILEKSCDMNKLILRK